MSLQCYGTQPLDKDLKVWRQSRDRLPPFEAAVDHAVEGIVVQFIRDPYEKSGRGEYSVI